MILQATSPIRLSGTIDRMHASFLSRQVDTMVAVVKESPFIWRGPVSSPTPKFNVNSRPRRQEFRPEDVTYRETGSIYLSRVGPFIEKGNRIHGSCALHVLDAIEGADVDTVHDLAVVAALIETLDGAA
jgi:N-acylneuraminate cytidylyltransferase